ncbi:MAG: tyrosine recombinase XerC [Clostridiales bacterium]|nr:tyrosine recombinase XerC [Clostridiales bacterium]
MPKAVKDFATYKLVIQGCSERTVSEYLLDLRTFFRYITARRAGISLESEAFSKLDISRCDLDFIKEISTEEVYEFLLYADSVRKNEWAAKARKLSSLKAFFKFLTTKQKVLEVNPVNDIEGPKRRSSLPKYLSLDESVALLEAIKNDENSKTTTRDYAIITLFLNCGMRLSELVSIDLRDIDKDLRSLRVTGKGRKQRIVYLNDACKTALRDYLKIRISDTTQKLEEPALFLSSRNRRISVKTVQWIVYKYLDAAGLGNKGYSVHKLRHTAATLMYQSGKVDVRVLKDILGHEQLNTTQIYTHVSDKNMENAVNNNPLASLSPAMAKKKRSKKEHDSPDNSAENEDF